MRGVNLITILCFDIGICIFFVVYNLKFAIKLYQTFQGGAHGVRVLPHDGGAERRQPDGYHGGRYGGWGGGQDDGEHGGIFGLSNLASCIFGIINHMLHLCSCNKCTRTM